MLVKDYYKILEINPSATEADIKKSYRRLAFKYHPDKNFGNSLYEARFREIQEAYQILSDKNQRQAYNIKRNHQSQSSQKQSYTPVTPHIILNNAIQFRKKIALLDPDRMNKVALYQQIQHILVQHNISVLQQQDDASINKRIIEEILYCSRYLPFPHIEKICFQLTAIAGTDNTMYRRIYSFSKEMRMRSYWNRYKLFAVVIFAIILCIAIYLAGSTI